MSQNQCQARRCITVSRAGAAPLTFHAVLMVFLNSLRFFVQSLNLSSSNVMSFSCGKERKRIFQSPPFSSCVLLPWRDFIARSLDVSLCILSNLETPGTPLTQPPGILRERRLSVNNVTDRATGASRRPAAAPHRSEGRRAQPPPAASQLLPQPTFPRRLISGLALTWGWTRNRLVRWSLQSVHVSLERPVKQLEPLGTSGSLLRRIDARVCLFLLSYSQHGKEAGAPWLRWMSWFFWLWAGKTSETVISYCSNSRNCFYFFFIDFFLMLKNKGLTLKSEMKTAMERRKRQSCYVFYTAR